MSGVSSNYGDPKTMTVFLGDSIFRFMEQVKTALLFYDEPRIVPVDALGTSISDEKIEAY
jgi:hypothetical protein